MNPKSIVTTALLLFVAVSVGIVIGKGMRSPASAPADLAANALDRPKEVRAEPRVIAYYFHGEARCATCKTIEAYTRETIDTHFAEAVKSGKLEVRSIDFDTPQNEHFREDYDLGSSSVVLVDPRASGPGSWKVLQEVWQLTTDKPAFTRYVKSEIDTFFASREGMSR